MKRSYLHRSQKPLARRKPLKRVSAKRAKELKVYYAKRLVFLECKCCQVPGCPLPATDLHHKKGRGKYLTDEKYFMAVCRMHHDAIHANPMLARKLGFLLT